MSHPLDAETLDRLKTRLAGLQAPVRLVYVGQSPACTGCREQLDLLRAVADTTAKVTLETLDLVADAPRVRELGVDKVPATLVQDAGGKDYGIRFYGLTSGYEFDSLVEAMEMVAAGDSGLGPELEALVALIDRPLHLEVMVTLACPYCPRMVRLAHRIAFSNPRVRADMVDSAEFPELVQRYRVSGVPRTVVDGRPAFEGALDPASAVLEILKRSNPEAWERIDAQMRTLAGERRARRLDPDHLYDLLIVGAGPAAMTAALYGARKALDLAVIGKTVGGQMVNTESIENWPGIPEIGGQDLAGLFRRHAERFPVAERLGTEVVRVVREAEGPFRVETGDGTGYRARALIWAAGKRYRTLGVEGEARLLGQGIAFCATCDAPLYAGKRVAVIGGGNSAFTAARDLLPYAREIHIVNILPDFQADPVLYEQVTASPQVHLHPASHVRAFLGEDRLTGVRLESADGSERRDLAVEGVFLEIGLVPNSAPVADLLALDPQGQIPVGRDQATAVPGLFAAGDVTDEPDKQIVIAAAAGAKAALTAERYLRNRSG